MSSAKNNKKILFICPYPFDIAPGQRFRYEQYLDILSENQFDYSIHSFLDKHTNEILYKKKYFLRKTFGVFKGFIKRIFLLFQLRKYNFVFIFREAAPIGPPIFEWIIAKVFRKKIIYDFDDAIWLPNTSRMNRIISFIKWHGKVKSICRWAYKVSAGNRYLCEYASHYNSNVVLNPTTIDTLHLHNKIKNHSDEKVIIGWTGTHSTIKYLDEMIPIIKELEKKYSFEFRIIADKNPFLPLESFTFNPWNKETEINDLLNFNIGIMPLVNDAWSKGKCGFKALQYMALGIPPIVSPIGINTEIVQHGKNGFIADSYRDWIDSLSQLITNQSLRIKMGTEARKTIVENYSVQSNTLNFLSLFED